MSELDSDRVGLERAESVAREADRFTASASPLDRVKLELGLIVCLALLLWLILGGVVPQAPAQVLSLAAFGVLGMVWLVVRTRRVLQACLKAGNQRPDLDSKSSAKGMVP